MRVSGEQLRKPYKHGPAWLRWDADERPFCLIPEQAEIVRFTKVDEGWSPDRVARWLNKSGIQPWVQAGKPWQQKANKT